jgi:hypothetical protein
MVPVSNITDYVLNDPDESNLRNTCNA